MDKAKYDSRIKETLDSILLGVPEVTSGKMFGYPAYYVRKRLFACVYEDGIGIKVPEVLAKELIGTQGEGARTTNHHPSWHRLFGCRISNYRN